MPAMQRSQVRDVGEFPLIRRLRGRLPNDARVTLGVGDDCAALKLPGTSLFTTDTLVENVHFRREWTSFEMLGKKAFAVNASDIIAMGGEPSFALLSMCIPPTDAVEDLDSFFDGFLAAASEQNVALIGGNMSAAPVLMISVTLIGHAPHGIIIRSGAQVGDDVYVSGTLGDAALGIKLFQEGRNDASAEAVKARFLCPTIRYALARAIAAKQLVSAMLDVSDGLLQDLGHMCEESQCGAMIDAPTLPLSEGYCAILGAEDWDSALTGGENYELLFAASAEHREALQAVSEQSGCPITRIGSIVPNEEGIQVRDAHGRSYTPARTGHDHFRQS